VQSKISKYTIIVFLSFFIFSCKNKEKTAEHNKLKAPDKEIIKNYTNNTFNFNTVSGKAALTLTQNDKKNSFKITFRIKKDSVIWISITPLLGLEVARVMITPDSVFMIDRLHKTYYKNNIENINEILHIDISYNLLQNILLANPVSIEPENKKDKIYIRRNRKEQLYFVSNVKRRKYRKVINKDKDKFKETIETIWIYPDNFKMAKFEINDFEENKYFNAKYKEFQTIENQIFPKLIEYNIKNDKNYSLTVDYTKVNINSPVKVSFKIPSKYGQIK
tara:strand:- start:47597 stop:48427 length:831 start_codon:yes stop_codon:yes gene_type:complete